MVKDTSIWHIVILAALVILAVIIIVNPINKSSQVVVQSSDSQLNLNTITVSGTYTQEVAPDQAELYLTVRTEHKDSEIAQSQNAEASNNIMAALKSHGVKDEDIETTDFRVDIQREWDPETGKYTKTGIVVTNSMKVTIKDFSDIGKILDAVTQVGAGPNTLVEVYNLQFSLSLDKQREVNQELLSKAAENARKKAEAIADSLDVSIVKVSSVTEGNVYTPVPYYARSGLDLAVAESTPISPSDVTSTATVNVVFEIA